MNPLFLRARAELVEQRASAGRMWLTCGRHNGRAFQPLKFAGGLGQSHLLRTVQLLQRLRHGADPSILILPHLETNQERSRRPHLFQEARIMWLPRIDHSGCCPSPRSQIMNLPARARSCDSTSRRLSPPSALGRAVELRLTRGQPAQTKSSIFFKLTEEALLSCP